MLVDNELMGKIAEFGSDNAEGLIARGIIKND